MPNTNISDVWPNMGTYFGFRQPQINRTEEEDQPIREAGLDHLELRRRLGHFPASRNSFFEKMLYQQIRLDTNTQVRLPLSEEDIRSMEESHKELLRLQKSFFPVDESLADVKEKLEKMRQESVIMENVLKSMRAEFNKKKTELNVISNDNLNVNVPLHLEDINEQNLQSKLDAYNSQVSKSTIEIDSLNLQISEDKFLLHQTEQNILEETSALDVIQRKNFNNNMTTEFKDVPFFEKYGTLEDLVVLKSALTSKININTEICNQAQEDLQNLIDREKDKVKSFLANFTKQLDEVHSEQQRSLALSRDAQQNSSKFLLAQKDQVSVEMANLTEKIKTVRTDMIVAEEARLTSAKNLEQANLALDKYREQYSKSCDEVTIAKQNREKLGADANETLRICENVRLEGLQANYTCRLDSLQQQIMEVREDRTNLEPILSKLENSLTGLIRFLGVPESTVANMVQNPLPIYENSPNKLYDLIWKYSRAGETWTTLNCKEETLSQQYFELKTEGDQCLEKLHDLKNSFKKKKQDFESTTADLNRLNNLSKELCNKVVQHEESVKLLETEFNLATEKKQGLIQQYNDLNKIKSNLESKFASERAVVMEQEELANLQYNTINKCYQNMSNFFYNVIAGFTKAKLIGPTGPDDLD